MFECALTNNPLCVPARSSLLTGQYSRTCGGSLDNSFADSPSDKRERMLDTTIAEQFKMAGYKTALIGKWHTYTKPCNVGFDYSLYPRVAHSYRDQVYYENEREFVVHEFSEDYNIAKVEEYLTENMDTPFFLHYNISLPHMPLLQDVPEKYSKMFSRDDVILRENVKSEGRLPYDENWFLIYLYDHIYYNHPNKEDAFKLPEGFDIYDLYALYYGAVKCVDEMVGRLSRALEDNGLEDDTIILFCADHGDNLGSFGYWNKSMLIEESIRIPMIVSWPGIIAAQKNDEQIAQTIDIMPTLLDLAGIEIPDSVQGKSLADVLLGEKKSLPENYAFIETNEYKIGIRTPVYLYAMEISKEDKQVIDDSLYFYDLIEDPYQKNNLAKSHGGALSADRLKNRLLEWNRKTPWLKQ
jgi:arylsulfatase A-like enzyme